MVKGTDKYLGLYGLQLVQYIHASQYWCQGRFVQEMTFYLTELTNQHW